ncbi:condensin-2 complex subunit H2-like [Physella acuta]|uniref:condensin-2 complex subunit H2-like n=1 Tax=Physella acuta TaxID=109671 RepID=UPI0027DDA8B4|nr:condensin-2 complex subunit H2-like [Physella acuta]
MSQNNGSQCSLEERFSHILQPIRDLAKNWDVDIAHFLEEYLEDLEKIEITFDDGMTTMNFSEAALLIQGSAGVYAKKVEYLHSLVYQVLDLVTQKKKTAKSGDGENGADNEDNDGGDTDAQFLPLDDIPDGEGSYTKEQDITSNKNVRPVPEMPTRLIPLEEAEKGDSALFNKKGELMGNHCDFNIDTAYISVDGSLLLEMGDNALLNIPRFQPFLHNLVEEEFADGRGDSMVLPLPDDHDDDGDENPVLANDDGDIQYNKETAPEAENLVDNIQRKSSRQKATIAKPQTTKPAYDPWLLLDPYEKSKAVEKPLKKKKPFKIPPNLQDNTTKKRKKKVEVKKKLPPLFEVVESLYSHKSKFPKNPLKVPEFPELEDAFWKEYKVREELIKQELKTLKKNEREAIEQLEDNLGDDGGDEEDVLPLAIPDDDNEDDDVPALQLNPDIFVDHSNARRLTTYLEAGSSSNLSENITMSYEDLVQKHVEKFLASAAEYAQITELSRRVSEWEEKIKPKLEEEEKHEHFDIHRYGTYLIEQLVRGEKRAFRELVRGKQEYEICRYLLATLQLANVYNVELTVVPDEDGNIMDSLHVTLLSTKRHFEDLEEYTAPSLKNT